MFTGIITNKGRLKTIKNGLLVLSTDPRFVAKTKIGDSVAVNGVCLTAERKKAENIYFSVMPETLKRTNLDSLKVGSQLNLEHSLTVRTLLSGHLVQGHIDGVGEVKKIKKQGNSYEVEIVAPAEILRFLVTKGSVALNGTSLTIANLNKKSLVVAIIPHTWENTNLKDIKIKDKLNIEVDIVAKYIKKFLN